MTILRRYKNTEVDKLKTIESGQESYYFQQQTFNLDGIPQINRNNTITQPVFGLDGPKKPCKNWPLFSLKPNI